MASKDSVLCLTGKLSKVFFCSTRLGWFCKLSGGARRNSYYHQLYMPPFYLLFPQSPELHTTHTSHIQNSSPVEVTCQAFSCLRADLWPCSFFSAMLLFSPPFFSKPHSTSTTWCSPIYSPLCLLILNFQKLFQYTQMSSTQVSLICVAKFEYFLFISVTWYNCYSLRKSSQGSKNT